jgi:hypothetical protein
LRRESAGHLGNGDLVVGQTEGLVHGCLSHGMRQVCACLNRSINSLATYE